jgi:hypothetical protein
LVQYCDVTLYHKQNFTKRHDYFIKQ